MLKVSAVPALSDNYIWLIHSRKDPSRVVVVDPGEAAPVTAYLREAELEMAAIFITHRHPDHTGGVAALREMSDVAVFGPSEEAENVVTQPLPDRALLELEDLGLAFNVLHIPGHTLGHIAFHGHGTLFPGDTLFSAGCGRLFEGTPEQMTTSLEKLARLPADTSIYCGHEYTLANLAFAAAVEPGNAAVRAYRDTAAELRERNTPTLPSNIGLELRINPFLRTSESSVRRATEQWSKTMLNDKVSVFAALRRWKDNF